MKWYLLIFSIICSVQIADAQISKEDSAAIAVVLLTKEISVKIFFHYGDEDKPNHDLPSGNYAFIIPDTSFQTIYKNIVDLMPYTLTTDGLLYLKKFYKDSTRTIYIDGIIHYNLFIVFEQLRINSTNARIVFYTTSRVYNEQFKDRYVRVFAQLIKKEGEWIVAKQKIESTPWFEYLKKRSIDR